MTNGTICFGWHTTTTGKDKVISGIRLNQTALPQQFKVAAQIFLKSPMKVSSNSKWTPQSLNETRKYVQDNNVYLVVHGQYIINFCRNKREIGWAIESVIQDLNTLQEMTPVESHSKTGVVIHLGKNVNKISEEECINNFVENVQEVITKQQSDLRLILETSTKTKNGNDIFHDLRVFGKLNQRLKETLSEAAFNRIGYCIDTAHVFASGYDIRTRESFLQFLDIWDQTIGVNRITLFHLNDSKVDLDCCRDLHEEIGTGYIYKDTQSGLTTLLKYCQQHNIPIISETGGDRVKEIDIILGIIETNGHNQHNQHKE
ncbi:MAG: deoxyribonuclease IV [Proteobacteria bacterium]|nr:deoxyribonuclease IV [Pseudomonadota bacterium]NBP15089.1 deoxyribonuclease IV [bacterium]